MSRGIQNFRTLQILPTFPRSTAGKWSRQHATRHSVGVYLGHSGVNVSEGVILADKADIHSGSAGVPCTILGWAPAALAGGLESSIG